MGYSRAVRFAGRSALRSVAPLLRSGRVPIVVGMGHADWDETGVVDFYLENYREFEGQAQYDAWISGIGAPFDFTGESYLEEYTRPLRERTTLMEHFAERIEEAWKSITWGWCEWPTLTQADLEFMTEIDQCIFEDGDYFLRHDPTFFDDSHKLKVLAMGRELATLSRDFWERLRELGAIPKMVREANHLFLLRECGEEFHEESSIYRDELAEAILDYMPHMEEARAKGLEFWDVVKADIAAPIRESTGTFLIWHSLTERSIKDLKECLAGLVHREEARARAIFDAIASEQAAESRKRGWSFYSAHQIDREAEQVPRPGSSVDASFLAVHSVERCISAYSPPRIRALSVVVNRRTGARCRESHGAPTRTRGSRRSASRSSPDDPDESEPALGRLSLGSLLESFCILGAVAAAAFALARVETWGTDAWEILIPIARVLWSFVGIASQIGGALALVLAVRKCILQRRRATPG